MSNTFRRTGIRFLPVRPCTILMAVTMLSALSGCGDPPTQPPVPPNVVLIVVDTLRADRLGVDGYPRNLTPCLDGLAREGVYFRRAVSQSSWTLPSMISLMTGRHIFTEIPALPAETPSLAGMMKARGYATSAFIANSLVGEKEGFAKGFDHFEIRKHKTPQWDAAEVNRRVLPYMETSLKGPFFLYVHYLDPHFPYEPPEECLAFEEDYDPLHPEKRQRFSEFYTERPEYFPKAEEELAYIREQLDRYDGEVRHVDRAVGEVLDALKRLGLSETTVVAVTADHGECLWDHRHHVRVVEKQVPEGQRGLATWFFRDHGYHLYDELIRVPFIVEGPGIRGGRIVDELVENVDLLPTLLELAGDPGSDEGGGSRPPTGDGRSLAPFLRGSVESPPKRDIAFSHCNEATCAIQPEYRLKLVAPNKTGQYFGMDFVLYDLSKDPWECRNVLNEIPDASRHLLKAVEAREKNDYFKDMTGVMDEATKQKMDELGYAR